MTTPAQPHGQNSYGPSPYAPVHQPGPGHRHQRQRGRLLLVILTWVVGVVGVVAMLLFASKAGDVAGATLSIVYALIPLPLLVFCYWWLDRVEPEPLRYKFAAFVWGAVVAVGIALVLETLAAMAGIGDKLLATVVAPFVEEGAKGLFLVLTLTRRRRIIDSVLDGVVVAGIVGIGFAMTENVGYYAASYFGFDDGPGLHGAGGATATFVIRGLFSPFAHPLFTSMLGIAFGLAVARRSVAAKLAIILAGYLGSVSLHALWNGSASYGRTGAEFIIAYLVLGVVLSVVAGFVIANRMQQIAVLRRALGQMVRRGWLHPDEVNWLAKFGPRRDARRFAQRHGGSAARDVMARYQAYATEVAFLHEAVVAGHSKPDGIAHTYALLDEMHALRPYLWYPPRPQLPPSHLYGQYGPTGW